MSVFLLLNKIILTLCKWSACLNVFVSGGGCADPVLVKPLYRGKNMLEQWRGLITKWVLAWAFCPRAKKEADCQAKPWALRWVKSHMTQGMHTYNSTGQVTASFLPLGWDSFFTLRSRSNHTSSVDYRLLFFWCYLVTGIAGFLLQLRFYFHLLSWTLKRNTQGEKKYLCRDGRFCTDSSSRDAAREFCVYR